MAMTNDTDNLPRFLFPKRPLCVNIADCAGADVQAAYINLLPYPIVDTNGDGAMIVVPPLFISDGMSTPDFLQGRYQADEGISAGHTHDYLYSCGAAKEFDPFCKDGNPRKIADEILGDFLHQHCPGYKNSKADACELAVRIGGGKSFRDDKRDDWRAEVAMRLFGGGMGKWTASWANYGLGFSGGEKLDYNLLLNWFADRIKAFPPPA